MEGRRNTYVGQIEDEQEHRQEHGGFKRKARPTERLLAASVERLTRLLETIEDAEQEILTIRCELGIGDEQELVEQHPLEVKE